MNIADFTEQQVDPIVEEWAEFARTNVPAAKGLNFEELADHAKVLLMAVAADIRSSQTADQKHEKSRGDAPAAAPDITRIARDHADQRFGQGFSLDHLLSEFRALRASVIRRWTAQMRPPTAESVEQLTRFGESMDQAFTASLSLFSRRANDARNLLLGVLGHDLRNPLAVVEMTSEYLHEAGALRGEQLEAVARIQRSAERMKAMVQDLLDFTQTALGVSLPVSARAVNLRDLAVAIIDEVSTVHPACQVQFATHGDVSGTWDPERISQLLSNLVANAVQHGERGKLVLVDLVGEADSAVLRVSNQGPDISAEAQRNLFSPLGQREVTTEGRSRGSSGLGLGLYITRQIALAHGGSIAVSSGGGTTAFTVELPRTPPARVSAAQETG